MSGPQEAKALLRKLVTDHFFEGGDGLEWGWQEGVTLRDKDAGLEDGIRAFLTQSAPQAAPQDAESLQAPVRVLSDDDLLKIVWKLAPSAKAEAALVRHVGQYEVPEPTHLLRRLGEEIAALASIHPSAESEGSEK